ncbi:MAG: PAS domain S-box protein, partial [Chloroflexota bacterium]
MSGIMNGTARLSPRLTTILKNLLLALVCLPVARLGLLFAFESVNVSLVWPMTGVAVAVLLLLGREYWPGMGLAVLAHNLINQTPLLPSIGIAFGAVVMALAAVYVLQKKLKFRLSLERVSDVLSFALVGAILAPILSAVIGVACLSLAGLIPASNVLLDVLTWWIGDAMGVLVVAPVLLIWSRVPLKFSNQRKLIEAAGLILLLLLTCLIVFNQGIAPRSFYPLAYLIFPFLIWGALRFDQRMVVSLTLLVALIAVLQTGEQFETFNRAMIWNSILFLWAYIATMAITSMLLAATLAERRQIEQTISSLEKRFSKAFHAAPVAIWISTVEEGNFIDVNEEFCTIMGYSREEVIGKSSLALNIWETPEVRARLLTVLEMQGRVSQMEIHLRQKSGGQCFGLISTDLIELEGEPHLLNMFHDLTARFATEEALRDSQERYRQLFEGIDDTIFVHDLDANILDVNEAATRHLGYSREELLSMKVTDLDVPEFAAGFYERLQDQLDHGFLNNIEGRQITKDGREIIFDVNTKLISYKGRPAVLGVDRDVTERKRAEQQLRESEARYRAIVEDQSELICRFTPDFILTFVNDAYCRHFDKPREALIGTPFMPTIYEEDQLIIANILRSLTAENPVMTSENRGYMPDGSVRWHQWRDHAIIDENGKIIEYQSVGKDITEVKELEKQRLAIALEHERVQILADFIVAASHDFRTPLSVINTSA